MRGEGLRVRIARISGITPSGFLDSPIYLPVALGDFTVSEDASGALRSYQTIGAGTFSQASQWDKTLSGSATRKGVDESPDLRTLSLDALTLDWAAVWLVDDGDPTVFRETVEKIQRNRVPFELLAMLKLGQDLPEELRMYARFSSHTRSLKHGEVDTRYWTIGVEEYRDNSITPRTSEEGRGKTRLPTTHVLKVETTLMGLAKRYYGDYAGWRTIAAANGLSHWGPRTPIVNTRKFRTGQKVKIPRMPSTAAEEPSDDEE